jgi:hypothetical protein
MDALELKSIYPALKKWYGTTQIQHYGPFPLFWQDLEKWSQLRIVLKTFENEQGLSTTPTNNKWSTLPPSTDPIEKLSLCEKKLMFARIRYEDVCEKLSHVDEIALELDRNPRRSPSPDPVYNA